ncbi:MAG: hypothetical protein Q8M24_04550 [Pseudolabrys sp.]|nr:hypothetical protein [Pseudolabrys sp.]MDP2294716.1 hypothetical protein [Pseudolabrys sp.]
MLMAIYADSAVSGVSPAPVHSLVRQAMPMVSAVAKRKNIAPDSLSKNKVASDTQLSRLKRISFY